VHEGKKNQMDRVEITSSKICTRRPKKEDGGSAGRRCERFRARQTEMEGVGVDGGGVDLTVERDQGERWGCREWDGNAGGVPEPQEGSKKEAQAVSASF